MTEAWSLNFESLKGKFVVFDGPDGCGKTTQMKSLHEAADRAGVTVRRFREPGGTPIGEHIRELLLSDKGNGMDMRCEMLLYMASRAQLVHQQIKPALAAGEFVLADRYASSTIAYQGGGGGLSTEAIMQVADIAVDGVWPDLTVVFDLPLEESFRRQGLVKESSHGPQTGNLFDTTLLQDRIEQRAQDFFERVRQSYLDQAAKWPERYRIVDASKSIAQVTRQVNKTMKEFFAAA